MTSRREERERKYEELVQLLPQALAGGLPSSKSESQVLTDLWGDLVSIHEVMHVNCKTRRDIGLLRGCVIKVPPGTNRYGTPRYFLFRLDGRELLIDNNEAARHSFHDGLVAQSKDLLTSLRAFISQVHCATFNTERKRLKMTYRIIHKTLRAVEHLFEGIVEQVQDIREEDTGT